VYQIEFQGNYNHYSTGFAGWLDLAWAPVGSADSEFQVLYTVTDYHAHWQGAQHNYTVPIVMPSEPCDHCVLRARYNSHKPGEQTFYNCADIRIVAASGSVSTSNQTHGDTNRVSNTTTRVRHNSRTFSNASIVAVAFNPVNQGADLVSVNPATAAISKIMHLSYGVRSSNPTVGVAADLSQTMQPYIMDSIVAYDYDHSLLYYVIGDNMTEIPNTLLQVNPMSASIEELQLSPAPPGFIISLAYETTRGLLGLSLEASSSTPGSYVIHLLGIEQVTGVNSILASSPPDNTYINYQWSFISDGTFYALMQNENDADHMTSVILSFDLETLKFVSKVVVDVSSYTFGSVQADVSGSGLGVSLSPGLSPTLQSTAEWSLVVSNLQSGAVKSLGPLPQPFAIPFDHYYGGVVATGSSHGALYHVMRYKYQDEPIRHSILTVTTDSTGLSSTFSPLVDFSAICNPVAVQ
jgi:hypothetical protein